MGIIMKDDGHGIERFFIELDDENKNQLIYKHPDQQIRKHTRVNVDMDYVAVFVSHGKVIGILGPGFHALDEGASAPAGWLLDHLTADGYYDAELFYVTTREQLLTPYGGTVDSIADPNTGIIVTLKTYGEVSYKIIAPATVIAKVAGTGTTDSSALLRDWVTAQVLAATREEIPAIVSQHGVVNLGSLQDATEASVAEKANLALADVGVMVTGFGQMVVNVDSNDMDKLKELTERAAYVKMAGSYDQYARSEALLNLGGGDSGGDGPHTGGDSTGSLMGILLLNSMMAQQGTGIIKPPVTPVPTGPVPTPTRPVLVDPVQPIEPHVPTPDRPPFPHHEGEPVGVRECSGCGKSIANSVKYCPECGTSQGCPACGEPRGAGRFCSACGHQY